MLRHNFIQIRNEHGCECTQEELVCLAHKNNFKLQYRLSMLEKEINFHVTLQFIIPLALPKILLCN